MDDKVLHTLEYDKILERLVGYTAFSASGELARNLRPTTHLDEARRLLAETGEARLLLDSHNDMSVGGARDVREQADAAARSMVLQPPELLDVKATLISARTLGRIFEKLERQAPNLFDLAAQLPPPLGLVDAISKAISDRSEILDTASPKLGKIRKEMRAAHDRVLTRMQRMLNNPDISPYLQDSLVTQRDGRYVLPLRADAKGRVKAVVHDQSASGATLFVEPLAVVELNNKYRELQLAERDEERRILAELSDLVGEQAPLIIAAVEVLAELDLAFAKAKYALAIRASEPVLHDFHPRPKSPHPGVTIKIFHARHPLLDPETVVPIDVEFYPQTYALLITGPNTGGKTVTLKTVGLLALMAQSGLHIPAQSGSELSIFDNIYADIGDEQSIEQSLSTFSGHITNIIRILAEADEKSLVILDELGAGTDPQEGSALARAILTHLLQRGITILVATHYPELKAYAHATPGIVNASVEFDMESLRPTYHLTLGLPGRSNALSIAQRLGLPEELVESARTEIDPDDLRAEDLLDEIHRQRDQARSARAAAEEAQREAESLRAELAGRLDKIEDERREIMEIARKESAAQIEALDKELGKLRRQLSQARQPLDVLKTVEEEVGELEETVQEPVIRRGPDPQVARRTRPIRLGDKVILRTLGQEGVVNALSEEEAEVQLGVLRVRARLADLELAASPQVEETPTASPTSFRDIDLSAPSIELDIRGQRVEDALEALERYLDAAYLAGMPFVRIIHGKGTGRLRKAVREALSGHAQIKSFEPGQPSEGGEGVTVAKLREG